jgi:hypothetical protein
MMPAAYVVVRIVGELVFGISAGGGAVMMLMFSVPYLLAVLAIWALYVGLVRLLS